MKINTSNTVKIQALLDSINGKADTHTFTSGEVRKIASEFVKKLSRSMSKKGMIGAKMQATSSEPVSRSYNHKRVGNSITLEVFATGVFMTRLYKTEMFTNQGGLRMIELSDDQKNDVVNEFCKG
jgi:hypothetical protein